MVMVVIIITTVVFRATDTASTGRAFNDAGHTFHTP